jgi:hypothetical protein
MSRQLPTRPDLEHLKKQAKDLLEQLQQTNPAAQLADAQHSIAREYGFASWPKLKAHVESQRLRAGAASSLDGRWTADPTRSKPHPANPWRTATIVFEVDGDDIRITDIVVDASGREERHVNTIRADGVERMSDTGNDYSVVARWRDEHSLETVGKKDGQVVGSATYQVSDDGGTLTISAEQQLVVLSRSGQTVV